MTTTPRATRDPVSSGEQPKGAMPGGETALGHPVRARFKRHRVRWVTLLVAVVVGGLFAVVASSPPAAQYNAQSPLVGHRSPAIAGTTLTGASFHLAALRGHFVVVDFFASWCVPCQQEQGQLVSFAKEGRNGARLVGVIFLDTKAGARSLLGPWIGLYPVIADPGALVALNYGVRNPPDKFVIDPRGAVVARVIGPVTAAGLNALIARAKAQGA